MASSQSLLRVIDRASGFLFIAVVLFFATPAAAKPSNFQQFFPKWTDAIEDRLGDECREVYGHLMNDFSPICEEMDRQVPSCRASRVIDCLSAELPESWKANSMTPSRVTNRMPVLTSTSGCCWSSPRPSAYNTSNSGLELPRNKPLSPETTFPGSSPRDRHPRR